MKNNITFTGINGLYIGKKAADRIGTYINHNGEPACGKKYYTYITLKCRLTDDANGTDLTNFKKALTKSSGSYQARLLSRTDTGKFDLLVKRCEVFDDAEGKISNSNFELNGISILPNERQVLPLFTYLAALTRKLKAMPDISPERKKYIELTNKSIAEEAVKFIDNM